MHKGKHARICNKLIMITSERRNLELSLYPYFFETMFMPKPNSIKGQILFSP